MLASTYHNLLFDFGNVIIDIDVEGAINKLKAFQRPDSNRDVIDHIYHEYECGRVSDELFINTFISQSRHDVQALDIINAWNSMLIGIPAHRLDMLLQLRDQYNVYLLSNTNSLHLEWVHRYMQRIFNVKDWERTYFDGTYYSHNIGTRKPDAKIYQYVIDDALLTPENTLFMDDLEANIVAAEKLGFGTKLVQPKEDVAEFLKVNGFY